MQDCWHITPEGGFLLSPAPLTHLGAIESPLPNALIEQLESLIVNLPALITEKHIREAIAKLPDYNLTTYLPEAPCRVVERLFSIYGLLASAYVHVDAEAPASSLPPQLARPLYALGAHTQRPPMLSYASLILSNWQRKAADASLTLERLDTLFTFTDYPDERWFYLVHVAIEARAGRIFEAVNTLLNAIPYEDDAIIQPQFREIGRGITDLTRLLHQMEEGCDPKIYFHHLRPYMMSFQNVVFEGVPELKGEPQNLRGGSGAQSSIVPALLTVLGIDHHQTELTAHLQGMLPHMPKPHRDYIANLPHQTIRAYVRRTPNLIADYNHCLHQLMTFRRAHLYYAKTYIFARSHNVVGTGGTSFMRFLAQLIDETRVHLL